MSRAFVLVVLVGLNFSFTSLDAAEKSLLKKSKPTAAAPSGAGKSESVEKLAETARKSVVVVSHFGRDGKEDGTGAGFVVSADGLIATCLHVIGEARPIVVRFADGKRFEATEVFAWDRKLDLAVVRIDAKDLPPLQLGDSETLKQGSSIVAMGNPLGLEHSIVQGVVSARRDFEGMEMIQLAIPIEPGNSGGPLLDLQGRVHGLLSMKSLMTPNLGFAIPVNTLKPLLEKPNRVAMSRWLTIGALNPSEWTPVFGARWSQRGGQIQVTGAGKGFGGRALCLQQNPPPNRPYEIAVSVRLDDESGAAGLVFAADGEQKHYGFYPSAGQLRLTRFNGPDVFSWTILQQVASPIYHSGEWNHLRVRVEDDQIRCFVNGQLTIESADHELTGGQVGLAKFRETHAQFKDFRIGTNLVSTSLELVAAVGDGGGKEFAALSDAADAALADELRAGGETSRRFLNARAQKLEQHAAKLRAAADTQHRESVQAELVKALRAPEEAIDLFHAALLIARFDNPELEPEPYQRQIETMAAEITAKLSAHADADTRLATLKNYLFAENGFHGSRTDYYDRANSYVNAVLDDREGLPITLSVVFIELAHRIGVPSVSGVPLPGHFVVKYALREGGEQVLDVFDGGKILTREQVSELVQAYTGEPLRENQLKAATKREIVLRMLQNLLGVAERNDASASALHYLDLILAVEPDSPRERLRRARLYMRVGNTSAAKADFKWLLDHEPSGIDLERIAEIYQSL